MKQIKFVLFLCLSATILSCSDSESDSYNLTNANIAGTYSLNMFEEDVIETTIISGVTVNVNSKSLGDTFQLDFIVNENGTYVALGQYRVSTTVASAGTTPVTNSEIINIEDRGTFEINAPTNSITFIPTSSLKDDFIGGTYSVSQFSATRINILQDAENSNGSLTIATVTNFSFVRK